MSDFVQTMKDWRRMCKDRSCDSCNLKGSCDIDPDSRMDADIRKIDTKVKIWAAKHPEPVYPTWEMYLAERMTADMRDGKTHNPQSVEEYMRRTSIPADIAEKLGIEPKEG